MKGMHITMRPLTEILERRGLEDHGRVQKFVDNEVLRLSAPYVPHLSGTLERSGKTATDIGSGEVNYNTPYARYQYYGKVMVGPAPKKVTDKNLTYHGGGLRGSHWFERMKADHKDEILRGAAQKAGGNPK